MDEVLRIAKELLQLVLSRPSKLIKKSSGDMIILSNLYHLAIEALIDPSEPDNFDTGVRLQIVASDKLHRIASGWWWMMNPHDSG